MPDTRESLQSAQEAIQDRGKINACEAVGMIMVICDALDEDATETMRKVQKYHEGTMRLGEGGTARIIADLLEISQSNLPRAISDIIEILELEDRKMEIDD